MATSSFPVLCRVYVMMDSYLSAKVHSEVVAQELLQAVAERMDVPASELILVAITYPGGKHHSDLLQHTTVTDDSWYYTSHLKSNILEQK